MGTSAYDLISNQLADLAWFGDADDADGYGSVFAEDGVMQLAPGFEITGRAAITEGKRTSWGAPPERVEAMKAAGPSQHHVSSIRIALIDDDHATSTARYLVFGQEGPRSWGHYTDSWTRVDGQWYIQRRENSTFGTAG